ncbi:MAG: L-seryl-tRNA(Sec) selenium transferase [Syntrophomonadaceae bacterium]|nr:L-seryl-tRNA(Sec) selenium transferase [Syntrophomonadaceae bacterium]
MSSLRNIPPVDELLQTAPVQALLNMYRREFVVAELRRLLEELRVGLKTDKTKYSSDELKDMILARLPEILEKSRTGSLRRVINATGVPLHTNLGRAPLSPRALDRVNRIAAGYSNLELDLARGARGSRYAHTEELLQRLTGAESALVVNNNAAAVLLGLTAMAQGREVIVSRGQLIEIGGSFRIPEVMKQSGARLVEVGSTNKTHPDDYRRAVTEETALLFSAHTSNYRIVGFTAEVGMEQLVALGREMRLPVMLDLGSGVMRPPAAPSLGPEPTVAECVATGADIVTFSGDKLLGGPQAGIILGRREYIDAMKQHQLLRALRVDKLTLAALEGTLLEYLLGHPEQNIPVAHMLSRTPENLKEDARDLARKLKKALSGYRAVASVDVIATTDMVGGGSYPTDQMPAWGVELRFNGVSLDRISSELRDSRPAVVARRQEDALLLSVRTLLPGDADELVGVIAALPALS